MDGAPTILVKETAIHHASGELRWLDGTSAPDLDPAAMAPVDRPLAIRFSDRPSDLQWLHKPGRTAFWRRPTTEVVLGESTEAQRDRPALPLFNLSGEVSDPTGTWQPRPFQAELGDGGRVGVVLYPSPAATRFGGGGGLFGMVRFDGGIDPDLAGRPAAWGLVEVTITVAQLDLRAFRAQCDGKGDFRLSLWRLPPLPQGTTAYPAQVSVRALPEATRDRPVDPDTLAATLIAPLAAGPFAATIAVDIVPGQALRLESAGGRILAIRPAPPPVPDDP
jgi:hypothetical protein